MQQLKPFTYSYSKLKNFENCPRKHNEVDLLKHFKEPIEPGGPLDRGNKLHDTFASVLKNGTDLPPEMLQYQKWIDAIREGPGELYVEQKYALTENFEPTDWWNEKGNVWFRGIGDVVRIDGPVALIVDWKTGKILVDSVQLMLMAQCIFSHYQGVQKVRSEFIWLKEDCSTPEIYSRESIAEEWVGLLPRVQSYREAYETGNFPPKPSGLCVRHCCVKSCQFHGKGAR